MTMAFIIGFSVLFQFATVFWALRLIRTTGGRISWILISSATFLMAVRRCFTLYHLMSGNLLYQTDILFELVGLITSILMFGGIVLITPLFNSIKNSEAEQKKLVGTLQKALSEIKTLSGMLPICASCKKIRDDKGYWNQLEAYIRKHTDAEFSHALCPECAKKLYPEYYNKKIKK
jgi:hypothetical protein